MKKQLLLLLLIVPLSLLAQTEKVYFDYTANTFEGNMPLPAEEKFQISGNINTDVDLVKVEVFSNIDSKKGSVYISNWKRGQDALVETFTVQMYKKLRGSDEYDFQFTYYRSVTNQEYDYTKKQLEEQINIYLENSADPNQKKWNWNKSVNVLMGDVNNIIVDGLKNFTNGKIVPFEGLSDNVKYSLESKEGNKIDKAIIDSTNSNVLLEQNLDGIMTQIMNEVEQYIHNDLFYAFDQREVLQYPTEKIKNTVAINIGYGGAWFGGGSDNFEYDHGPYAGVSIPFGKEAFAKPFWNNLSLSTGVFLTNFEDGDGNKVTGPIIQRPFYLGVGYKIVRFLKFQAGAVLLETKIEGEDGFVNFDRVSVRPYVGLSVEFNFWMDFAK